MREQEDTLEQFKHEQKLMELFDDERMDNSNILKKAFNAKENKQNPV